MFFLFRKKDVKHRCEVCHRKFRLSDIAIIKNLSPSVISQLKETVSSYNPKGAVCRGDLRKLRLQQIRKLFDEGEEGFADLESVLFQGDYPYTFNQEFQNELSLGERVSQRVTPLIGSWGFILAFAGFVALWMGYNLQEEVKEHFDPFPFILLNLFLSCMAAIQAPIIMMAQSRLSKRERLRADEDYFTNLKAELEIRQLHAKIDKFLKQREKGH